MSIRQFEPSSKSNHFTKLLKEFIKDHADHKELEYKFELSELQCIIRKHKIGLFWNGYVCIPEINGSTKWFWADADHIHIDSQTKYPVRVYGGITYADEKKIGFDTMKEGYNFSYITLILPTELKNIEQMTYKSFDFVKNEVEELAKQVFTHKKLYEKSYRQNQRAHQRAKLRKTAL